MTIGGRDMKIINHKFPVYKNIKKDLTDNSRQAFCYNGLGNNHKIRLKKVVRMWYDWTICSLLSFIFGLF